MVSKISEEELMDRIKKSCESHDKPIFLEEPSVVSVVVTILRSA